MNMMWLLLLVSIAVAASAFTRHDVEQDEWEAFKLEHKKQYASAEEERDRMAIYVQNKNKVVQHNELYEQGLTSYRLEINMFSDLTKDEIRLMTSCNAGLNETNETAGDSIFVRSTDDELPDEMDCVERGAVTRVKNQGKCGSCWAFSATGALEGQLFRKTGLLVSLSEQNLMDCSWRYGNNGCRDGSAELAFTYVSINGIDTEEFYPYQKSEGQCRFDSDDSQIIFRGFERLPRGSENALKLAVATIGPIAVAIDARQDNFHLYKSGVYFEEECSPYIRKHAVLVVGYGTEMPGGDYWLIKNSWGTKWGMDGYMKLARNRDNHCGIASEATFPLV